MFIYRTVSIGVHFNMYVKSSSGATNVWGLTFTANYFIHHVGSYAYIWNVHGENQECAPMILFVVQFLDRTFIKDGPKYTICIFSPSQRGIDG